MPELRSGVFGEDRVRRRRPGIVAMVNRSLSVCLLIECTTHRENCLYIDIYALDVLI